MVLSFNQVNKAFAQLEQDYQREPTAAEIAEVTLMHPEVVNGTLTSTQYHLSLDAPIRGDETGESSMYDLIGENESPSPDKPLLERSLKKEVDRTLATLDNREANIIRYYFGLDGMHAHSLEEIGHEMNLTRERVRQLKQKALTRLQKFPRNRLLKAYVA